MSNRLESLISAYNIKPKKNVKKKKSSAKLGIIKQSTSMNDIKIQSKKPSLLKNSKKKDFRKVNYSVQPSQRPSRNSMFASQEHLVHNRSLDEDMMKLEDLTVRNSKARLGLMMVQQRMIEIGLNKKLNPIAEIDESHNDDNPNIDNSINLLMMRIESKKRVKERMNSLDSLIS